VGIADIRVALKRLATDRGITIFLSSHMLSEVQQLATRIGVIHQGRLLEEIGYDELRQRNRQYLEFTVSDTKRAAWALEEKCGVRDFAVREEGALRIYRDFERADEFNRALVEAGVGISSMRMSEENLEDHFVRLTGEAPDDEARPAAARTRSRGWRR
jgi:bacitracin transport system ATP-binding protein